MMLADVRAKFADQWLSLSERDKKSAIALGIFIILAVVIFLIILPIKRYQLEAQQALVNAEETYSSLVNIAPQALVSRQQSTTFSASSLNSEIRRQAARYGLTIQRFEPDGENLRVWIDEARYPSTIKWLAGLEEMGITHEELVLEGKNKPGFVTVRATFAVP